MSYRVFGAKVISISVAIELSALIFFLVGHVMGSRTYAAVRIRIDRIVVAMAILAIVGSLVTIASRTAAPYYSVFSDIPPLTYVEFLFAVSITEFLPGFFALSALNAERNLGFLGMIFSYILSFFISSSLAHG